MLDDICHKSKAREEGPVDVEVCTYKYVRIAIIEIGRYGRGRDIYNKAAQIKAYKRALTRQRRHERRRRYSDTGWIDSQG